MSVHVQGSVFKLNPSKTVRNAVYCRFEVRYARICIAVNDPSVKLGELFILIHSCLLLAQYLINILVYFLNILYILMDIIVIFFFNLH